jgi:8-oxo-dGTP pyrophosphatase MutT (NUDIX family)
VHDDLVTVKHATASVFVFCNLAQGWRLGLIRHPIFGRLMIPGGHVEPDESQQEAALREVSEEAGLKVGLIEAPGASLPANLGRVQVAQPWWIIEQPVPYDNHIAGAHVHLDHLYVAVAECAEPVTEPDHPFGWYGAAELAGLHMFDDTRRLASVLFPRPDGTGGPGARPPGAAGLPRTPYCREGAPEATAERPDGRDGDLHRPV